jgi:hypothetical protein
MIIDGLNFDKVVRRRYLKNFEKLKAKIFSLPGFPAEEATGMKNLVKMNVQLETYKEI